MIPMKYVSIYLILSLSFVMTSCDSTEEPPEDTNRTQTLDFRLADLEGNVFQLSTETQGKVVVLNFFATTCPICQAEAVGMNTIYEKYKSRGVEFIGISIRTPSETSLRDYINEYNVPFRVLVDDNVVSTAYSVIGTPDTYFIDKEGWTVQRLQGAKSLETVESIIEDLL